MEVCSFLESKKNQKTFGATQAPNPSAFGGVGQAVNKKRNAKGFVKFGTKSFSFAFLFFVLHETKNLSRVNCI